MHLHHSSLLHTQKDSVSESITDVSHACGQRGCREAGRLYGDEVGRLLQSVCDRAVLMQRVNLCMTLFFSITLILRQSQREKYLHLEYKVIRVFVPCTQLKRAPTPCRISCCVIPHCYAAATLPLVPTPRLFQCYEQRGQSS